MGYATTPELVVQSERLLELILERVILQKREFSIPILEQANMGTEYYNLRRVLAAAARHPQVFNGRYRQVADLVRVRVNAARRTLDITPKVLAGMDLDAAIGLGFTPREKEIDPELLEELARHGITPESHNEAHEAAREKKKGLSMIPKFDPSLLEKKDE